MIRLFVVTLSIEDECEDEDEDEMWRGCGFNSFAL